MRALPPTSPSRKAPEALEVSNPPSQEQFDVQVNSELLTPVAEPFLATSPSEIAMKGRDPELNKSGKGIAESSRSKIKRVIYVVAGDDGSHVPTLRQLELHREKDSKNDGKTMANAVNLTEEPLAKQPIRPGCLKQAIAPGRIQKASDSDEGPVVPQALSQGSLGQAISQGSIQTASDSFEANRNAGETMANVFDLAEGVVGEQAIISGCFKQAISQGRIQRASDNYEEQSSNGIDISAEALFADKLETDSVDYSLQHAEEQNLFQDFMENEEVSSDDKISENDSASSSGSESDNELAKYMYPGIEELDSVRSPEIGMRFPTLEDAHRFYNTYALQTGFVAVRGRNYRRQKFQLDCNRSGKRRLIENPKRKRKRNTVNKTQCQAMVTVKLINGQWEYTAVRKEHNHPLCPSPSLKRFFLEYKHMSPEERLFLGVLQQSRVPPKKAIKILRIMRSSFGEIPCKLKDENSLQTAEQRRKENSDVERTLNHFKELQLRDPCFQYTMQTDEDNTIRSIFWTHARSPMDYALFGDSISFDTSYSTNKHNMPFTPIVGINNHGRTILLGCALLQNHKTETFKWVFETFLQVMGGKMPRAIITNQDEAVTEAIAELMPQVRHRFCKWDVMRKAKENLGSFMSASSNINVELNSLVDNSLTETEFEEGWAAVIERYDASENEYLELMWQTGKNWVPVYFREDFYPFVESTGRYEGANLLFQDDVHPKDRIENFIAKYEQIQEKVIKMDEEDRLQSVAEPLCFSFQPIEKHAAHIYTRQIFLKVQRELLNSTAFTVHEIQGGAMYRLDKVFNYENPEFVRSSFEVLVEPSTNAFKCQCAKFSRDGILCCHIFRLFTQFGIIEIPGKYIVPRWTSKFKEEQLKQYKEKCVDRHGINHSEDTMRYAMLMSKVADIGKQICGDGAKCNIFMLELDKIQEKIAAMTVEHPESNDS